MSEQDSKIEQIEQYEYSVKGLFEEAKNDPSWESDEEKRAKLTALLYSTVQRL